MSTKQITKVKNRFARYGPAEKYESPPVAGMCISVFGLVRRQGKKGVLLGLPKQDNRWTSEWISAWRNYSEKELAEVYHQWRLPSTYLMEGENPDDAIRRIMRDQLEIEDFSMTKKGPKIFSYNSPSEWYPGNTHWDLALVYDVKIKPKDQPAKNIPKWWQELYFVKKKKDFRDKDYGWNDDFMRDLGLVDDETPKLKKRVKEKKKGVIKSP
ncbi:MAG: hypothetical protein OK439_06525 [Thaumarchaeota archaeon]|nr:hypothetical protein [Nitrososphaerota archaeon]